MTRKKSQTDNIPLFELSMEQYILTKWDEVWIDDDISHDTEHVSNAKKKIIKKLTPILENIDTDIPKKKILKKLIQK